MDMDEFAQTRAPDDLFDEDYTPVAPVVTAQNSVSAVSNAYTDANANAYANANADVNANANANANFYENSNSSSNLDSRGSGFGSRGSRNSGYNGGPNNRDRGRGGRRRGGGGREGGREGGGQGRNGQREKRQGLAESKWSGKGNAVKGEGVGEDEGGVGHVVENDVAVQGLEGNGAEQVDANDGVGATNATDGAIEGDGSGDGDDRGEGDTPAAETHGMEKTDVDEKIEKRETAVRGDRSATGGLKRTKLTEAELSARLTEMSLKNASLTAAHKRAEADEASFQAREAKAATRRLEERVNRTQMLGERERNAQRKMRALGHREWDVNKAEEDYSTGREGAGGGGRGGGGGGGSGRRGMMGGGREIGERDGYATRPRRGNRGGRGNNSNKNNDLNSSRYAPTQQPPSDQPADFPPLPVVAPKQDQPSNGPPRVKMAIKSNAKDTQRTADYSHDTNQKEKVEDSNAETTEAIAEANPERKESLTLSEFGRQMDGQPTSWADQVEGAAG